MTVKFGSLCRNILSNPVPYLLSWKYLRMQQGIGLTHFDTISIPLHRIYTTTLYVEFLAERDRWWGDNRAASPSWEVSHAQSELPWASEKIYLKLDRISDSIDLSTDRNRKMWELAYIDMSTELPRCRIDNTSRFGVSIFLVSRPSKMKIVSLHRHLAYNQSANDPQEGNEQERTHFCFIACIPS